MKIQVYDKVKWHFPDGKGCPDMNHALKHFQQITGWLEKKNLLSEYGRQLVSVGIDSEFSLTSEMLTPVGNCLLEKSYDKWLSSVSYGRASDFSLLESGLKKLT